MHLRHTGKVTDRAGTAISDAGRRAWGTAWPFVAAVALLAVLGSVLVSSPVAGQDSAGEDSIGEAEVRIVARRLANGKVEFGL